VWSGSCPWSLAAARPALHLSSYYARDPNNDPPVQKSPPQTRAPVRSPKQQFPPPLPITAPHTTQPLAPLHFTPTTPTTPLAAIKNRKKSNKYPRGHLLKTLSQNNLQRNRRDLLVTTQKRDRFTTAHRSLTPAPQPCSARPPRPNFRTPSDVGTLRQQPKSAPFFGRRVPQAACQPVRHWSQVSCPNTADKLPVALKRISGDGRFPDSRNPV
jgi:hypothetical protein